MSLSFLMPTPAQEASIEAPAATPGPQESEPVPMSIERVAAHMRLQDWIEAHLPDAPRVPGWTPAPDPGYQVTTAAEAAPADDALLAELRVARAWRDGALAELDDGLAQLPADLADQHRAIAAAADRIRGRSDIATQQEQHHG